mgnify:CR=1 FL=1
MAIPAHHGTQKQRGTALIVSLLILIVLTILGVAAMSTNTMEEKMAGNSRKIDLAFQAAESALRDAQTDPAIKNNSTAFDSTCPNGLCLPSVTGTPVWDTVNWSTNARTYGAYTGAAAISGVPAPVYIIEKMPPVVIPGHNLSQAGSLVYRITSRATGPGGVVVVELQSVYEP